MTARLLAIACLLALALAACGQEAAGPGDAAGAGDATEQDEPAQDEAPAGEDPAEETDDPAEEADDPAAGEEAAVVVALGSTDLGDVLVDGDGVTLYLFDADEGGESTCYGDCAGTWPPLVGEAEAGDGVDPGLLGVTERTTGELQVTYAGHPLYYFAGDSRPGETGGQGIGEVWWVVDAAGAAVHEAEAVSGSPYDY